MAASSNLTPIAGYPDQAAVAAALDRVLKSACFEQAGRASEFLRFVVEQSLDGQGDRLKGYTIAIEVFGKPADFDAQSDPLVRVEAGRLRRRLTEYYATEGRDDPLRIELPRGSYEPQLRTGTGLPKAAGRRISAARAKRRIVAAFVLASLLAAVSLAVLLQQRQPAPVAAVGNDSAARASLVAAPAGPRLLVLPLENLSADQTLDYFAHGVTEEIMLRLADFELFVIASQTSWYYGDARVSPEAAGAEVNADYILTGTVRSPSDRVRLTARLVAARTGEQLWAEAYDESLNVESLISIEERIARQVVATIAVPYGPIYEHELARAVHKPAEHLDTYDCVLRYYHYRRTIDSAMVAAVRDCFERATVREPEFADAWAGLALMYLDEYAFGYGPRSAWDGQLARARDAARMAMDIDGQSYLANLSLVRLRFQEGDRAGFERGAERLLSIFPNNADALAMIGTWYAVIGEFARAEPLIDRAAVLSPRPPGTYHLARSLIQLQAGRYEPALAAALMLDAPNWFISPLLVAATAALAGRDEVAVRARESLLVLYPEFEERARDELAKWHLDAQLYEELLRGLRAAGFEIA